MVESTILSHLNSVLSVPAYMEEPEKIPKGKKYVILEKTGSSKRNNVSHATFAVQSYGPSMVDAAELNEDVKAAMESLIELPEIGASKLNSDYNFTDTTTKRYRYQAVFEVTHY